MRTKFYTIITFYCFTFFYSCNKNNTDLTRSVLSANESKLPNSSKSIINQNKVEKKKQSRIEKIISKIEKKGKLDIEEYDLFSNYILNNNDESFSENTGYLLFNYFVDNKSSIKDFEDYLITKDSKFKDKLLVYLVKVMCIDLADEKYNYEKLIDKFIFFKGNLKVKESFKECINNY